MIGRALLAVFGAIVITVGLLLAMDSVVDVFREDSGERYFRIGDILPRPDPGRPDRPAPVARQPETDLPDRSSVDVRVPTEAPDAPQLEQAARELATDQDFESVEPVEPSEPAEENR
jgi:hypothetical protein